jgi:hypothetical protein
MRSWLSSPAVAFLSFLVTVIALGQWVISVIRLVDRLVREEGKGRRRALIAVAVAGLVAVAIISPLTWTAVMAVAADTGNHGLMSVDYAFVISGTSFIAAWTLLIDARAGHRFPLVPCCMLVGGLGFAATMYIYASPHAWDRYIAALTPTAVMAVALILMLALGHAWSRHDQAREEQGAAT